MKRFFPLFFSIFFITFTPISPLYAWNALGHMVIANIAYKNLKPTPRKKVEDLLSYFQKEYPSTASFVEMAFWPDAIRSQRIESFTHWHYINLPFTTDGTTPTGHIDSDNAVWAYNSIQHVIKNERANSYERVRFLAFLIHITGDLHQPLHTISYFSDKFPQGDQGGNLYYIRYKNQRTKLHKLWDDGVGNFEEDKSVGHVNQLTNTITALYPQKYFGDKVNDLNANHWAQEGLNNAKSYAYTIRENQDATQDYLETGKRITQQQVALAGYRLANLLNQLLT